MLSSTQPKQAPNIMIYTLGKFDVIKDGKSLMMSSAGSKKIWELYKFMLTHRDRAFTPETLMDQLWVSESYNDPRSTLRRQMHRLRQSLIEEDASDFDKSIQFSNGYYKWNDGLPVSIDVDHFEKLIKHGDTVKTYSPKEALDAYKEALSLYHGDYLPDCYDQHWIFAVRNHYRRLYLRTVLNTIELLKESAFYDEIIKICQKAIQIDVYEEPFHLHYMDALLHKNDQKQALEHYEYITGFYYHEMGLKPSTEMKSLYKRLLQTHEPKTSDQSFFNSLESDEPIENAFYCDPHVFKSIYELERRRSQRSGASFSIGEIKVNPINNYSPSQEDLRVYRLKQHLLEHLRKGDSFTLWNDANFVVLLPGVDSPLMEKVLRRILDSYPMNESLNIDQIKHLSFDPPQPRYL